MNVLHAKIAISLHLDALDMALLLRCVLPLAFAAPVDGDLTVALHLKLDRTVIAPEAGAGEQPLAVAKGIVSHVR